jgi:hypothetical protein
VLSWQIELKNVVGSIVCVSFFSFLFLGQPTVVLIKNQPWKKKKKKNCRENKGRGKKYILKNWKCRSPRHLGEDGPVRDPVLSDFF